MADQPPDLDRYAEALRSSRQKQRRPDLLEGAEGTAPAAQATQELEPRHLTPEQQQAAVQRACQECGRRMYRQAAAVLVPAYLLIFSLLWAKFHILWGWLAAGVVIGLSLLVLERFVIRDRARADAEAAARQEEERYNARRAALPRVLDRAEALLAKREYVASFDVVMEAHELLTLHVEYIREHFAEAPDPGDEALIARARAVFRELTKQGEIPPDRIRDF
jgi:hypothetical protein